MTRYLAGRVAQFVFVVVGALLVTFFALHVTSDPALHAFPVGTPESTVEAFREAHGLNDPILIQAGRFLGDAAALDFGESLRLGRDALSVVLDRLPATILLAVPATLLGGLAGVLFGLIAARRPDGLTSRALNVLSFGSVSVAEFWLGLMVILVFAVELDLVPTGGYDPKPQTMILPIAVLALRPFGRIFQVARSTMTNEYDKQYVMAARAQGFSERAVGYRHVLRNAAIPIVTLAFYELSTVFVGTAVIVEVVFAWPGIGRLAVDALQTGDVFLVQAIVAVAAIATAVLNLVADLLYFGLDPRTRSLVKERHT